MWKKRICSIICIQVLGLVGITAADVIDASLVGWWKFDESSGTIAADSSGNGNDGVLMGDAQWTAGWLGRGLLLDGNGDYVDCGNAAVFDITEQITLSVWLKTNDAGDSSHHHWMGKGDHAYAVKYYDGDQIQFFIYDGSWVTANLNATSAFNNQWHHVAGTFDGNQLVLYVDGEEADVTAHTGAIETQIHNLTIGENSEESGRFYDGIIDDARIYSRALSLGEITSVMLGPDFPLASRPSPANGETEAPRDSVLTWAPGSEAATHNVYLSTNKADVDDGNDVALVAEGLAEAAYVPPEVLEYRQTYYWRVDEVNDLHPDSPWIGDVWTFTVMNFVVVDDFEAYNDEDNLIYDTWLDGWINGTGSTVGNLSIPYAEQEVVHSGSQSMPLAYDNFTSPFYSEAERQWTPGADWTTDDVGSLSLWFQGDEDASPQPFYLAVGDSAGNAEVVIYPDPDALLQDEWTQWLMPLTDISAAGVDLTTIASMILGVGDRVAPASSFSGTIYIDDIRLYRPFCRPDIAQPEYDFNDDCIVDQGDLDIMMLDYGRTIPNPDDLGVIYREAESADELTDVMQIYDDDDRASGGQYVGTDPDAGNENQTPPADSLASYDFTVPSAGAYKVIIRSEISPGNDSFWVRIPSSSNLTPGEDPDNPGTGWVRYNSIDGENFEWVWDEVHSDDHDGQIANWTLSAGTHTLEIRRREAGTMMDSILITPADFDSAGAEAFNPLIYDLNGDGVTDDADVAILMDHWLEEILWP